MTDRAIAAEALRWIVGILKEHKIPFQVSGGLAALAYGAVRPLNDIDIDVPHAALDVLAEATQQYIVSGPEHFQDKDWDLQVLTLNYKGQDIDLDGADSMKVFDKESQQWIPVPGSLDTVQYREVLGMMLPVKDARDLIFYKRKLNRTINGVPIDLNDAKAIEETLKGG